MVEQRWLGSAKRVQSNLALEYPPCVIDEVTDSFFAAPLLSIDESVIRAFPVDPFDVARTRRRRALSATDADALVGGGQDVAGRASMEHFVPPSHVRLPPAPPSESEVGVAQYAEPSAADLLVVDTAPLLMPQVAPAPLAPVLVAAPRSHGWMAGALIALAGVLLGGALVCAGLSRSGSLPQTDSSTTTALSR